jgi:hypothetical protein
MQVLCRGTIYFGVEYHILDLLWLHFHRTWILLSFCGISINKESINFSIDFHFQFDVWIICGL